MDRPDRRDTAGTDGRRRPTRGTRVGWILALVAAIPLAGMGVVTAELIVDGREAVDTAHRAEQLALEAVALARLDGALFDEMVWTAGIDVARGIGVPADLVGLLLGGDPTAELPRAAAMTDDLIGSIGDPQLRRALDDVRSGAPNIHEVLERYGELSVAVEHAIESTLRELVATPDESARALELREAVDALELGIVVRGSVADAFYGYFATVFDLRDAPRVELTRLISASTRLRAGLAAASDDSPAGSVNPSGAGAVDSDPAFIEFAAEIDGLIERSLASGLPERGLEMSVAMTPGNLESFSAAYQVATRATSASVAMTDAAAARLLSATDDVRAEADRDIVRSFQRVALLTVATLVAALIATRMIVRPLRALQRSADGLRNDSQSDAVRVTGPAEVRAAALAIDDAAAHLDLVTRQARALAVGDLDADVLHEDAPSSIGTAVQRAVVTLRAALARQEEYRRRLSHEASHDGLTKIANRTASMEHLDRSLARTTRSGGELAVLFVDLDRFKDVNDVHGHQAGDAVLTTIADRLVSNVREGDHVGRLGGDEFLVVAEPVEGIDDTVELAQRLLAALVEPIEVADTVLTVGASIGIAVTDGSDLTADELLRDADLAVYRAKAAGRGGLAICDEDLRNDVAVTADLSTAIRGALDRGELAVRYQPIVRRDDRQIRALEALVHWHRPGFDEPLPPGEFIGFAERSDLIVDIDRWVISTVVQQLRTWHGDARFAGTPIAINVSARHLGHDRFVDHVLGPLGEHRIDPALVVIEVTETAVLDDFDRAGAALDRLRSAGVRIAIDDFGTGYTSLSHLRALPVDIVKVDRSFTVNALGDDQEAAIVKLIIDTGHALGATVTADGVESALEVERLTAMGVDHLQGRYVARPEPPERLAVPMIDPVSGS
jgi:diguanylate cyclase (GGDEF)-like protein